MRAFLYKECPFDQLVSVMGAGLLVGTALSVIIPEGMQTLVMAYSKEQRVRLSLQLSGKRRTYPTYRQKIAPFSIIARFSPIFRCPADI
jgi:hypothetical protein